MDCSEGESATANSMVLPRPGPSLNLPDNRCCFCTNLRTGTLIIGITNAFVNSLVFSLYATSATVQSNWSHPSTLTDLDATIFSLYILQIFFDAILLIGAIKKAPNYVLPWLCANSILLGVLMVISFSLDIFSFCGGWLSKFVTQIHFQIIVALLLFFGYIHMNVTYSQYVVILSLIGILAGAHFFCFLVVFQFRKNLIEEIREIRRVEDYETHESQQQESVRRNSNSSLPPSYDEISKEKTKDFLPPEYSSLDIKPLKLSPTAPEKEE